MSDDHGQRHFRRHEPSCGCAAALPLSSGAALVLLIAAAQPFAASAARARMRGGAARSDPVRRSRDARPDVRELANRRDAVALRGAAMPELDVGIWALATHRALLRLRHSRANLVVRPDLPVLIYTLAVSLERARVQRVARAARAARPAGRRGKSAGEGRRRTAPARGSA